MTTTDVPAFSEADLADLKRAKRLLEYPGLIVALTNFIGEPIEKGIERLPANWKKKLHRITEGILMKGLEFAIFTLGDADPRRAQEWLHKSLVAVSGGVGGVFGLPSIPIEMPISTAIILRAIADIARSEGHDISLLSTRLECLSVLALGGAPEKDDASDTGYWAVRTALNKAVPEAVEKGIAAGLGKELAEKFARFIAAIAARFSVIVAEEAVMRTIPLAVGSVAAGTINVLFMNHFQEMARGHFIVKRLEGTYGTSAVAAQYEAIQV